MTVIKSLVALSIFICGSAEAIFPKHGIHCISKETFGVQKYYYFDILQEPNIAGQTLFAYWKKRIGHQGHTKDFLFQIKGNFTQPNSKLFEFSSTDTENPIHLQIFLNQKYNSSSYISHYLQKSGLGPQDIVMTCSLQYW